MRELEAAAEPPADESAKTELSVTGMVTLGVILVGTAFLLVWLDVDWLGGWVNKLPFILGLGCFVGAYREHAREQRIAEAGGGDQARERSGVTAGAAAPMVEA